MISNITDIPALFEVVEKCEAVEKKDKTKFKATEWWVYLIRTASDHLYCGVTTDVERRFKEHQNSKKGAKFLKGKGPLVLAWSELVGDKKKAMQLEYRIKRLSKAKKESIVDKKLQVNALVE